MWLRQLRHFFRSAGDKFFSALRCSILYAHGSGIGEYYCRAMYAKKNFKKPLPLGERKERLRQALLTQSGTLIDPKTLPTPLPVEPEQERPPIVVGKVRNVVEKAPTAASVNYLVPNESGHLSSVISGHIYGRVYRNKDVATVGFRRESDNAVITVRGRLPVVETGLRYTMEVNLILEQGKQIYMFQRLCGEGIVSLPITGLEFRDIICKLLRLDTELATIVALEVSEAYITNLTTTSKLEKLRSAKIPITHIYDNFKGEVWYQPLCESWGRLKYKFYPELLFFWSYEELSRLALQDLKTLYEKFQQNPIEFFLSDYRNSRLTTVSMDKIHLVERIFKCGITQEIIALVKFFNAISAEITETKCISLTSKQLNRIAEEQVPAYSKVVIQMAVSARYKLLVPVHETGLDFDPHRDGNSPLRYYRTKDHMHLRVLKFRLNRIMARPPNCIVPLEGIVRMDLNKRQKKAVQNLVEKVNIVLVSGDGGTGKTLTSVQIYGLYGQTRCLPVAAYTGLATRNHRAMMASVKGGQPSRKDSGVTIDYLVEIIRRNTKQGQKLANCVEVLLVDEVGVVSMDKFSELLSLLPNIKKIFMTGDVKQCKPVTPGRVLDGFLGAWSGTDHIVYLKRNMRVDPNYSTMVDNFSAFLDGRFGDIKFSTDLLDDIPFKVIRRLKYPEFGGPRTELMIRELSKVYHWLSAIEQDASQITIISQVHADVDDLNAAWLTLKNGGQPYDRSKKVFRPGDLVRFTRPYRPSFRGNIGNSKFIQSHLRCDRVDTNDISEIEEIYDISTTASATFAYRNRHIVPSTSAPYVSADVVRMIKFKSGSQINLNDYHISQIVPGYATTILSSIGHERNWIVLWIPPWQKYFYREVLYTAMTRAKKGVVFIMNISEDMDMNRSDVSAIWKNLAPPTENAIALYIPKVAQEEKEVDLETFLDALAKIDDFDPTYEGELRELEEELLEYETVCPLLGDDSLERDAERIIQHFAKLKEPQKAKETEREEYRDDSLDLQPSQHEHFASVTLDQTQTFEFAYELSSDSSEEAVVVQPPTQPKRNFGWIADLPKKSEPFPAVIEKSQPKRLRRSTTGGSFSIEESRTAPYEDIFDDIDRSVNIFEALAERPNKRSGRTVIDD